MDFDLFVNILYATIRTGTPLLLVALGEMVCEKSGVLNLGQEGMMLMGAVTGFIVVNHFDIVALGFVSAAIVGMLMAILFAVIVLFLNANQVATGLALTIFGSGLSAFIGADYEGKIITSLDSLALPILSDIPVIGHILFNQDLVVYFSFAMFVGIYLFFKKSRGGLILRSIGENPDAANVIGLSVLKVRFLAICFGGAMAGIAGAYLSIAYTPLWTENMTSGRGWIALALVVFASWRAERIILGAYLFGFASIIHLVAQGLGFAISSNLLAILPYAATIVILIMLSANKNKLKLYEPVSLGKPWFKKH
ncbi:ABC transporter permease [Psychromonas antarctica]|uniref:ABC transporter permease n=1 Tax=Psychromonas antarctica TaxID=67573 RepID=UPI001EE7E2CE|nr:ABC transporter permease [Psychromonas antarctica]MCG6202407.1 ABC transporter permease [Psychromonas antarctica]